MSNASPPPTGDAGAYEGADATGSSGDVAAEWKLLDAGAALLDSRWRRFFPATGEERREFLHGQTSGNVAALAPGDGCAALVLTAQGRPLSILALYETGERIWIATTAAQLAATRAGLSRFLVADDCDFEDDVDAACVTVAGPRAAQVLAAAGAHEPSTLAAWGACRSSIAGQAVMLFSRGDLRVPSFDVLACDVEGAAGDAGAVRSALEAAGALRCGTQALEIVRVESGTARYGVDVDESRIAVEARLEWAIHFAKGCYVGQEVVERAVTRGRINHELCLLRTTGAVAPGARIEGGGENDVVTSAVYSPRLGELALAYLPRTSTEPGTSVIVKDAGIGTSAVVLEWPRARVLAGRG